RLVIGSDIVNRFTEFGAVLRVFENFGPDLGEPQAARRTLDQTNAELGFKLGNPPAYSGSRHLKAPRRLRKTLRLRHAGKNDQRVEIRHYCSVSENVIPNFAI